MLTNPQKSTVNKKERCGNYICFTLDSGSRIAFPVDKTIAHTEKTIKNLMEIRYRYIYDVVLLPSSSRVSNLRDSNQEDNLNNTYMSFQQSMLTTEIATNIGVILLYFASILQIFQ